MITLPILTYAFLVKDWENVLLGVVICKIPAHKLVHIDDGCVTTVLLYRMSYLMLFSYRHAQRCSGGVPHDPA